MESANRTTWPHPRLTSRGADNDTFLVQFARFRPSDVIRIDGGGYDKDDALQHIVRTHGTTTRSAPTGGACGGSPALFQVKTEPLPEGDVLSATDSDSIVARDYVVNSSIVAQVGGPSSNTRKCNRSNLLLVQGTTRCESWLRS